MAWSAHKTEDEITEHFCDPNVLDRQATELADLIKNAKRFVVFTGAGISTSAGIPDFRGPEGVWTLRAQGRNADPRRKTTSTLKAVPTRTHMALVELQRRGLLRYLVSQNCDGLHRRSGIRPDGLSELHGNTNLERCTACGREYLRDFSCSRRMNHVHDHETGRKCQCGGALHDSIINFGEPLPSRPLQRAERESRAADVFLVLGSSLTVTPACDMPRICKDAGGTLAVCNLQKTPLDDITDLRIFSKTDDLMTLVMQKLEIAIPEWRLERHVRVLLKRNDARSCTLSVDGVEPDGTHASIFTAIQIHIPELELKLEQEGEPFDFDLSVSEQLKTVSLNVRLYFIGHYNEPVNSLKLTCPVPADRDVPTVQLYKTSFQPQTGQWTNEKADV